MWLYLQKKSCESASNEGKCILVFWYTIGSNLKAKRSTTAKTGLKVQTMYYDYKLKFWDEVRESGKSRM